MFDSIKGCSENHLSVASVLREYLSCEFLEKNGETETFDEQTMPSFSPYVPRQPNDTDCGLFVIQYIESFFQVRKTIRKTERQKDRQTFLYLI
jgi:Ulp1 family protease